MPRSGFQVGLQSCGVELAAEEGAELPVRVALPRCALAPGALLVRCPAAAVDWAALEPPLAFELPSLITSPTDKDPPCEPPLGTALERGGAAVVRPAVP